MRMSRELTILSNAEAVAARAAEIVAQAIAAHEGRVRIVLAGGTTPRRAYELLAAAAVPWGRVEILFGDERCVPPLDAESNYAMALGSLMRTAVPATVHRIPAELGAESAAALYEPVVAAAPLDLVLLGLGPDGHTASLFPGSPALNATSLVVAVHGAPKPPPDRVSLTLVALRSARRVVVLATGSEKADAVRRAIEGAVPAGMIENAEWLVSEDCAPAGSASSRSHL
jgi:6-phosphogluconolactonase